MPFYKIVGPLFEAKDQAEADQMFIKLIALGYMANIDLMPSGIEETDELGNTLIDAPIPAWALKAAGLEGDYEPPK